MITILVKEIEEVEIIKEENAILKAVLKDYVKKSMDYKELLEESLESLYRYQEEVSNLKFRANLWVDETVRQYFIHGDLKKALRAVNEQIILYELKNINNKPEEDFNVRRY